MVKIVCPKCNVASDYLTEDELDAPLVSVHCSECGYRIDLHDKGVTNRALVAIEIRWFGEKIKTAASNSNPYTGITIATIINEIADNIEKGTWEKEAIEAWLRSRK